MSDSRNFKQPRRQQERKRRLKIDKFASLQLLRNYSISFNLYNVAELSSNRKGENGTQVEIENEKFTVTTHVFQKKY